MNAETIEFRCIEVQQPIGAFYIGAIDAQDLIAISYADVRRIEARDIEKILGIQRPLSGQRVRELTHYVNTVDASFPTSVILAVSSADASYDPDTGAMQIRRDEKVAKIIDGQHRIAGLVGLMEGREFEVNVTIFVDMDIEDQAVVFSTINIKQTKVNKSLVYDLFDYATSRSPEKTCHNIARLMNSKQGSPFCGMIKILGVATEGQDASLTQATFVERLLRYVSRTPMVDRDTIKRGERPTRASTQEESALIFRNMFLDDQDASIAKVVWNYFEAIAERWPQAWPTVQRGNVINRTTGFGAFMRFLRPSYLRVTKPGSIAAKEGFREIFQGVKLDDSEFTSSRFKPGSSGEKEMLELLIQHTGINDL